MRRPLGDEPLKFQRAARHNPTEAEKRLWSALRNRQLAGAKFRKQVWLGRYLVDFYCAEAKLAIEVDGDTHAHREDHDARRTAWLEREGFRIVRFANADVMHNLDGVADAIARMLAAPHPPTAARRGPPSLEGRGVMLSYTPRLWQDERMVTNSFLPSLNVGLLQPLRTGRDENPIPCKSRQSRRLSGGRAA